MNRDTRRCIYDEMVRKFTEKACSITYVQELSVVSMIDDYDPDRYFLGLTGSNPASLDFEMGRMYIKYLILLSDNSVLRILKIIEQLEKELKTRPHKISGHDLSVLCVLMGIFDAVKAVDQKYRFDDESLFINYEFALGVVFSKLFDIKDTRWILELNYLYESHNRHLLKIDHYQGLSVRYDSDKLNEQFRRFIALVQGYINGNGKNNPERKKKVLSVVTENEHRLKLIVDNEPLLHEFVRAVCFMGLRDLPTEELVKFVSVKE